MKKLIILFLLLMLFSLLVKRFITSAQLAEQIDFHQPPSTVYSAETKEPESNPAVIGDISYTLNLVNKKGGQIIHFHSYPASPDNVVEWKTDIFITNRHKPDISLVGLFRQSKTVDIEGDGIKEVEVELLSGKLTNSVIYKYKQGELVKIPVSTEQEPYFSGVVSSDSPEFVDLDGDGVLEMLVPHRHYPPERKRTIEVYKFNGAAFEKINEYEETTKEIYL